MTYYEKKRRNLSPYLMRKDINYQLYFDIIIYKCDHYN